MALPPKDDPSRSLHLAVRWSYAVAALYVLLDCCSLNGYWRLPGIPFWAQALFIAGNSLSMIAPAAAYVLFAVYLGHRRYWAVVASLVLSAFQFLELLSEILTLVYVMTVMPPNRMILVRLIGCPLVMLSMVVLSYYLVRSFSAVDRAGRNQGFEPIIPEAHVAPLPACDEHAI